MLQARRVLAVPSATRLPDGRGAPGGDRRPGGRVAPPFGVGVGTPESPPIAPPDTLVLQL